MKITLTKQILVLITFAVLLVSTSIHAKTLTSENIKFESLDGKIINLSDFKGQWVVVNYWATWCPPCRKEMPELNLFYERNKDRGAIVLGVNYETIEIEKVNDFLDEFKIDFLNVREINGADGRTTSFGQLRGLPTTYMVSPAGKVVATRVGLIDSKMLESFIAKYEEMAAQNHE